MLPSTRTVRPTTAGTDRIPTKPRLNDAAHIDPLTALLNRGHFFERLDSAIARAKLGSQCIGVMLLNLDNFKKLNARRGRLLADFVLVKTAERLTACTRKGDVAARACLTVAFAKRL